MSTMSEAALNALLTMPSAAQFLETGRDFGDNFPMYTVSVDVFLKMERVKTHEEMMEANELTQFEEGLGNVMFVSHQWLGGKHPDPHGEQLKVLRDALANIMSGVSQVCLPVVTELIHGRMACPSAAEFRSQNLYIWYDYFCCPQDVSGCAAHNRQNAIYSIPSYIAKCEYFVILCPALRHVDYKQTLSQATWAERGWCRTERMAHGLAVRNNSKILVIESAMHQTLVGEFHGWLNAPGEGKFTQPSDRTSIGPVVVQMIWNKLLHFLKQEDWHSYRFLLNEQGVRYLKNLDVDPLDGLVTGSPTNVDPFDDPKSFALSRFLHQNGFKSPLERDERGWSPLCFAVMRDDVPLVEALLDAKADVNDATTKPKSEMSLPKKLSVLSLSAFYSSSSVMKLLLSRRANVNERDAHSGTPLHWAAAADNAEGMRILCDAGGDPKKKCLPGLSVFDLACACDAVRVMKYMFAQTPSISLKHSLHFALMFYGGYSESMSFLIEAKADVNEKFDIGMKQPVWWLMMNIPAMRHRVSPSRLTALAYHHSGATPLMFSILSGYFEATSLLLAAGARIDIRNYRNKTAADLAREMQVPADLLQALQGVPGVPAGSEKEEANIQMCDDFFSI